MLTLNGVFSSYVRAQVVHDLAFSVERGEVVVLLGRNGAGKTTTLRTVMGLLRPARGRIRFEGHDIAGMEPHRIARLGLGYVPEDRRIFTDLTVRENLEVGRQPPREGFAPWTEARLFALFPNLAGMRDRPGGQMSGGEQQMLTLARTLMGNPRLILLDEPSEGLSPLLMRQVAEAVGALKQEGLTVLLAEQNVTFARRIADRAVVIERGTAVWQGSLDALDDAPDIRVAHLGV